ncbi:hypothetical protein CPC197_0253B, partial [Chlamydia psittaci C1/97]
HQLLFRLVKSSELK